MLSDLAGRAPVTRFLYLVRHGQAEPHDGPLSPAGTEQARLTGERLRDVPLAGIYHGPLPRAAQTAELIAESLPGVRRWSGSRGPGTGLRTATSWW
jgi:broad specificity phosphatase PhoE